MILSRIQVEGYKALRNPVELKDLGLGVHLIHGPNETGKSTLISAVARALFDRYNTQDQEIKALRPWGTELAPRVTLEFETAGKRFRLEKKFLDEEGSALSEWNGSRFERVADSVKADDRVRSFLLGTAARSGASGLSNWGLARLLWMTQSFPSRMRAPELDETLRQHLLGVLGSAVLSEPEQKLIAKLDQAYDVYYTAAKGSEKKGSPLHEARERLARAEEALASCKGKWDEVSRWNETAADAQGRLKAIEAERVRLDAEISALKARSEQEVELENLLKVKDQQLLVIQGRFKALSTSLTETQELERSIARHLETQAQLEPKIREEEARLSKLEQDLSDASLKLQAASEETARLSRDLAKAALLAEAKRAQLRKQELSSLLENARGLERELQAKKDEYASRKRPKDQDLEEARALRAELEALQARSDALGIEVQVLPERADLEVSWKAPGLSQSAQGASTFKSADQGELWIPGFGRVLIRSGAQDSKKLKERLPELEAKLQAKLGLFGVASVEELQALRAATSELEAAGSAQRAALNSVLQPRFKAVPEIAAELERASLMLQKQLTSAGLTEAELAVLEVAELRELDARMAQARQAQEAAQKLKSVLDAEASQLRRALEQARASFEKARQGSELLKVQLESKLSQVGGREALHRELGEVALEKNALENERAALALRLPPLDQRASAKLAGLARLREEAAQREETARREFDQAQALLAHAQGEGYYSKLAAAEEERALAAELLAQRESQAQGTRVLRALALAKRDRLNSNLLSPIEGAVASIFSHIRGTQASAPAQLRFGGDLHELGVQVASAGTGEKAGLDVLSLGTQEQAMFALRLAFGELLASRGENPEPQLVVLDDPLVNADPARQERARELLRRASSKLQILILTARPEDYRGLSPKEYDLAQLKAT